MASIRQRGKKKTWYALYRDDSGKLIERSCKTSDKKKAQEMADKYETLARPSEAVVTAEGMRKVLAELHRKVLGADMPKMSVRGYFEYWLKARKNEVSEDTYEFYAYAAKRFLLHLGKKADDDLFKLQKNDVVEFRDAERERVSSRTTNHLLKGVRMVLRQAKLDTWSPENAAEDVKAVKSRPGEKTEKKPFSPDQIKRILKFCDAEWADMVIRGYYCGQRLLDIATMTAEQEDPFTGQVKFLTEKTETRVIIEMPQAYIDWVLSRPSPDDPHQPLHPRALALTQKRSRNRTVTLSNQFTAILEKAGIRKPRSRKKLVDGQGRTGRRKHEPLSFHSLRHSMISHMADAGVSRTVAQDIVGHESAAVNATYTHLDRKTKQDAMAKLPDITK